MHGVSLAGGPQRGPQAIEGWPEGIARGPLDRLVPAIGSARYVNRSTRHPPVKLVLESEDIEKIKAELREEIRDEIIADLRAYGVLAPGQTVRRGWLTVKQVAEQLACGTRRIYYLVEKGSLAGAKMEGRRLLISQQAIDDHLKPVGA